MTYTAKDIREALEGEYERHETTSSNVTYRYQNPNTGGGVGTINVPNDSRDMTDEELEAIAHQAGHNDLDEFLDWVDDQL